MSKTLCFSQRGRSIVHSGKKLIPSEKHLLLKKHKGGMKEEHDVTCGCWCKKWPGSLLPWSPHLALAAVPCVPPASEVHLQFGPHRHCVRLSSVWSIFYGGKELKAYVVAASEADGGRSCGSLWARERLPTRAV